MTKNKPSVHDMIWLKSRNDISIANLPMWAILRWNINLPLVVCRDRCTEHKLYANIWGNNEQERYKLLIDTDSIKRVQTAEEILQLANNIQNINLFSNHYSFKIISGLAQQLPMIGISGSWAFSLAISERCFNSDSDINLVFKLSVNSVRKEKWLSIYRIMKMMRTRIAITIENEQGGFSLEEWLTNDRVLLDTMDGPVLLPVDLII